MCWSTFVCFRVVAFTRSPAKSPSAYCRASSAGDSVRAQATSCPSARRSANPNTDSIAVFRIHLSNGNLKFSALVHTPTPVDVEFGSLV